MQTPEACVTLLHSLGHASSVSGKNDNNSNIRFASNTRLRMRPSSETENFCRFDCHSAVHVWSTTRAYDHGIEEHVLDNTAMQIAVQSQSWGRIVWYARKGPLTWQHEERGMAWGEHLRQPDVAPDV